MRIRFCCLCACALLLSSCGAEPVRTNNSKMSNEKHEEIRVKAGVRQEDELSPAENK
jgi:hypothetical protein